MQVAIPFSPFNPVAQPYITTGVDQGKTAVCFGPVSKATKIYQRHPTNGMCWGEMPSEFCDTREPDVRCIRDFHLNSFAYGKNQDLINAKMQGMDAFDLARDPNFRTGRPIQSQSMQMNQIGSQGRGNNQYTCETGQQGYKPPFPLGRIECSGSRPFPSKVACADAGGCGRNDRGGVVSRFDIGFALPPIGTALIQPQRSAQQTPLYYPNAVDDVTNETVAFTRPDSSKGARCTLTSKGYRSFGTYDSCPNCRYDPNPLTPNWPPACERGTVASMFDSPGCYGPGCGTDCASRQSRSFCLYPQIPLSSL